MAKCSLMLCFSLFSSVQVVSQRFVFWVRQENKMKLSLGFCVFWLPWDPFQHCLIMKSTIPCRVIRVSNVALGMSIGQNTILVVPGALAYRLQHRTASNTSPPAESKMADRVWKWVLSQAFGSYRKLSVNIAKLSPIPSPAGGWDSLILTAVGIHPTPYTQNSSFACLDYTLFFL